MGFTVFILCIAEVRLRGGKVPATKAGDHADRNQWLRFASVSHLRSFRNGLLGDGPRPLPSYLRPTESSNRRASARKSKQEAHERLNNAGYRFGPYFAVDDDEEDSNMSALSTLRRSRMIQNGNRPWIRKSMS